MSEMLVMKFLGSVQGAVGAFYELQFLPLDVTSGSQNNKKEGTPLR